ncbi:MAG: sprT domain-containing protein [Gammaproteobacteria bacterium (ex Lamellibrachia satsuma)]|nr:MAG: sprT domain-containing protein [Gammaproteobacteria bacterium (ex Lamellibrachia satsuma)]
MADQHSEVPLKPTKETYGRLQLAYDVFNKHLFGDTLPDCLITLQRRKRSYGYFCGDRFGRDDGRTTDEIALNPAHFRDRLLKEILATLAHEMVHLWQHHFGKPGRGRYHNREWADQMKIIGLQPTDTGEEGGKETGDSVHHIVVPKGRFDRVSEKLIAGGFSITWIERPRLTPAASSDKAGKDETPAKESKSGKRIKYVCTHEACELKAWAKHDAHLMCGDHVVAMVPAQ